MSTGRLVTSIICCKFKKKTSLKSDFIQIFFIILYMYIAPGQGQDSPSGTKF